MIRVKKEYLCEDYYDDYDNGNNCTSDKPHTLKTPLKKKYMPESEQHGAVLEKTRKYSRINNSPFHLKNK